MMFCSINWLIIHGDAEHTHNFCPQTDQSSICLSLSISLTHTHCYTYNQKSMQVIHFPYQFYWFLSMLDVWIKSSLSSIDEFGCHLILKCPKLNHLNCKIPNSETLTSISQALTTIKLNQHEIHRSNSSHSTTNPQQKKANLTSLQNTRSGAENSKMQECNSKIPQLRDTQARRPSKPARRSPHASSNGPSSNTGRFCRPETASRPWRSGWPASSSGRRPSFRQLPSSIFRRCPFRNFGANWDRLMEVK